MGQAHLFSRPSQSQVPGGSTNSFVINSVINSLTDGLLKYLYGAATPYWFKMVLSVIKRPYYSFVGDSESQRAPKSHYWFKSYVFAELVDFAYWWSCPVKGLCLQPAQQFCYLIHANISISFMYIQQR